MLVIMASSYLYCHSAIYVQKCFSVIIKRLANIGPVAYFKTTMSFTCNVHISYVSMCCFVCSFFQSIRIVYLFFCNSQYSKQVMFNYNEIFSLSNLQLKCRKNKSKPTSQNLRDPPIATTCACLCS